MKNKNEEYYLNLPWTYTIEQVSDIGKRRYFIIRVNELPGICTDNESLDEAMKDIRELISAAIDIYQKKGEPVPEPINAELFKGNITYRTNSKRHYLIAKTAKRMHKSISKTLDELVDVGLENLKGV